MLPVKEEIINILKSIKEIEQCRFTQKRDGILDC